MANERLNKEQETAFDTFNEAVREAKTMRIKLKPGECLVVDNGRIFHGRSSLQDNSNRLLKHTE